MPTDDDDAGGPPGPHAASDDRPGPEVSSAGQAPASDAGAASTSPAGPGYGIVLWQPDAAVISRARMTDFAGRAGLADDAGPGGYQRLWQWSVDDPGRFWSAVWDYFGVLGERGDGPALSGGPMPEVSWFPAATLNYARNALRAASTDPGMTAVVYRSEAGHRGTLSYGELAIQVARTRAALSALGVSRGDRVAGYLPNGPHALIALLATASLGAIWTSCSPDFGAPSVIDRFAQVEPAVLIAVDGYVYGGKAYDRQREVGQIAAALPGLTALIMVDYIGAPAAGLPGLSARVLRWDDLARLTGEQAAGEPQPEFTDVPFSHPLWVLYSSGTTGLPKPIVHGHGGIVLEHLKALALHQDLGPGDVFFWYTTTGWMMWNYLVGGLLVGATVVLYDGSAVYPGTDQLWRLTAEEKVSYAGTGAPYLLACMKEGIRPRAGLDLTALRGVGSTGSPLPPEGFRWVYEQVAPARQAPDEAPGFVLGSFSGGTDLCTGFVGPSPLLPVRTGMLSGPCLGAAVAAFDSSGHPVTGEVGELVLTKPMPSMPVGFWGDDSGERYRASYFADFPGVWRHGDWVMMLPDGGCVIYGRSDATLNRGGVRMGTSEFYRVVERFDEVADSLVVDTGRLGAEGRLILYLVPAPGCAVDEALAGRIRAALRSALSPRHVPDEIHQVPGIPRTLSGKKLEVPVRRILQGTPAAAAADPDALANPEVLAYFEPGGAS